MIIAIDFDETIVEHEFPGIGDLKPNAKKVINQLYQDGHCIIIWTCRYTEKSLIDMKRFLYDNDIKYHKINENSQFLTFNPYPKIYADIYIDDKQLGGLPLWLSIYDDICYYIKNGQWFDCSDCY